MVDSPALVFVIGMNVGLYIAAGVVLIMKEMREWK